MAEVHPDTATSSRRLLEPSKLGTKEYWDAVYVRELQNYAEDDDDEGTVWFDESNAEQAVVKQLENLEQEGFLSRGLANQPLECSKSASRFLDLGTGNGHMLFALRDEDDDGKYWRGEMVGVDYSAASVELAQNIATQKYDRESSSSPVLQFECWDLLNSQPGDWLKDGFDVVLDKGTFDAISLMSYNNNSQNPCETYRRRVQHLVKCGSFLFITSCNWTKDELTSWLAPEDGGLDFYGEAKYPTFTFGGMTGQSVVTVIFRRNAI